MFRNQSQVADLFGISVATDKKTQTSKHLIFSSYYLGWIQKSFDINIEKLQPYKRAMFFQICKCNILLNQ